MSADVLLLPGDGNEQRPGRAPFPFRVDVWRLVGSQGCAHCCGVGVLQPPQVIGFRAMCQSGVLVGVVFGPDAVLMLPGGPDAGRRRGGHDMLLLVLPNS